MFSIRIQRIIQFISFIILGLVFWNYYKLKNKPLVVIKKPEIQTAFEKALDCSCDQEFVETPELTVIKSLPDDIEGVPHQKWIVKAPTGHTLLFVHNLKLCERLNLKKGDHLKLSGEFKWTDKGGLIHWAHRDPQKKRHAGFVEIQKQKYCLD